MSYLSEQNIDAPISRWKFEETSGTAIDDDVTATRDGTLTGGVTLNQAAASTGSGLGADFNGTTGYIAVGNASGLLATGTVEAVVVFDTIPTGSNRPVIWTNAFTSGNIIPLALGLNIDLSNSGLMQVGYYNGAWEVATWPTSPSTGTVYHIVGTYDGTTLRLRVNGVEVASTTVTAARPLSGTVNTAAYIGRSASSSFSYFDGRIYDVALYTNALSTVRADTHYSALVNPFTDNFANAGTISGALNISYIDTTGWTTEGSEPGSTDKTGWAKYTPSTTRPHKISTVGSDFDTKLAIYTGVSLGTLSLVASDDNSGASNTSVLEITLNAGTQYYIQVGAQPGGSGGLMSFMISARADSRLAATTVEALTDSANGGPQRRLSAITVEALTNSASIPDRRLGSITVEAITDSATPTQRRLSALSVEVLTPAKYLYVGWGIPHD